MQPMQREPKEERSWSGAGPLGLRRRAMRRHELDGAALYFQPATGLQVRVATEATRRLRRRAPRVAMFGITNACNLRCGFCSRDVERGSEWTVASAAAALRGLAEAGTLEVAYGGGEPFAFRGFAELVAEVDETTLLAQHVTTNGTLIDDERWAAFAGRFGQVRISIYEETSAEGGDEGGTGGVGGWRRAAAVLARHGQLWGGNVLVDAAALPRLPGLIEELAALGCHDVSLLSYVGPDRARLLDGAGAARLAQIVEAAALPCRLSVCFGDRVAVPRLYTGDAAGAGDCGAGRDFLSITPDRRVQSCSFQERSLPGATAEEMLAAWRSAQVVLAAPSPRRGCARMLPTVQDVVGAGGASGRSDTGSARGLPAVSIWRGFSGNNSGECAMVATFGEVAEAEAFLAEVLPGWRPDEAYSEAWVKLFTDENVMARDRRARAAEDAEWDLGSPRELVRLGRTVMAMRYGLDDTFPELRALAWKRGAESLHGVVHSHGSMTLVAAVRAKDAADRERLIAAPTSFAAMRRYAHGELMLLTLPLMAGDGSAEELSELRDEVLRLAADRPFHAELHVDSVGEEQWLAAKRRLGHPPVVRPRLRVSFWESDAAERAQRFAEVVRSSSRDELEQERGSDRVTVAGGVVLVDPAPDRKRLAVLGIRHGGTVVGLDCERLLLQARVWYLQPAKARGQPKLPRRKVDAAHLEATLRLTLPREAELRIKVDARSDDSISIETAEPGAALAALARYAQSVEAKLLVWIWQLGELELLLHRVVDGVGR